MRNLAEKRAQAMKTGLMEAPPQTVPTTRDGSSVVRSLVGQLSEMGVRQAFGVSGGAIALLFDAIEDSSVALHHFRHETGAAFAATEAYFASGDPTVVFATTGPGALNALTGITAAKWDGAKVILITGATSVAQRGRWATQETSSYTLPQDALYGKGAIFDYAIRVESPAEYPEVMRRLAAGLARPGGFIAHVCIPMAVQAGRIEKLPRRSFTSMSAPTAAPDEVAHIARLLKGDSFAIWLGFGASKSARLVREFVERTGVKVFCSPRGKGILNENHPQFLGVTGLGGHSRVTEYMVQNKPARILVLGTRLGEATSFWDRDMVPGEELIHVDIDPEVPGTAYPTAQTLAIHAEIGSFLTQLIEHFPMKPLKRLPGTDREWGVPVTLPVAGRSPVRPQVIMDVLQKKVVEGSDALVLAECGNSFAWCNHHLRFDKPGRYRVSTLFGSMGHAATGVVGAALARQGKAWAVVGDGSMLMNSEVSSAAQYRVPAVWVVLNDAGYGMCRDGHRALSLTDNQFDMPRVDFAAMARSMGAQGVRVETEDMLDLAFDQALAADGPFVIDVSIDPSEASPLLARFESLIKQGGSKHQKVSGWEIDND